MVIDALPIAATIVVADLLRLLVFWWLWRLERAPYLKWWTLSFGLSAVAQAAILTTIAGVDHPAVRLAALTGAIATTLLLMRGTYELIGRPAHTGRWAVGAALGFAWGAVLIAFDAPTPVAAIGVIAFLALAHLVTAWALAVGQRGTTGLGRPLSVGSIAVMGLHYADYPLVGHLDAAIPWGLAVYLMTIFGLTLGFALLHSDRSRRERDRARLRLDELAQTLGVGVFRADADGRLIETNPALLDLLGCATTPEARALDPLNRTLDALSERGDAATRLRQDGRLDGMPTAWTRPDGAEIPLLFSVTVESGPKGTAERYRGVVVDRSRAAALEAQIREAQRLDAVGQLAAGVAHDFNNLLMVIGGSLELLHDQPLDDEGRAILRDASQATVRASWLTSRLLAFGRRQSEPPADVALAPILAQAATLLDRTLGGTYRLDVAISDEPLRARVDATELEQAILNLVINARDAMPDGGTIRLALQPSLRDGEQGAEIVVADRGVGISAAQREHIFEPFYTTKEPGRGTGLGLPLVHGLVTRANGTIDVDSTPGEGTTFTLWLPTVASDPP